MTPYAAGFHAARTLGMGMVPFCFAPFQQAEWLRGFMAGATSPTPRLEAEVVAAMARREDAR